MKVKVGDKVFVPKENKTFVVQARDDRYIICTDPDDYYFIVDLVDKWRAPDNMIFCRGYETKTDCEDRLRELQNGEIELSVRRGLPLDIDIE